MGHYMSERTRVRYAIFPALYLRWYRRAMALAREAGQEPNSADQRVMDALTEAHDQALIGLDAQREAAVRRRIERLHRSLMAEHEGKAMITSYLLVSYALAEVLKRGCLDLIEGSAFDRAYEEIKQTVLDHGELIGGADKSATKSARRLIGALERERVL